MLLRFASASISKQETLDLLTCLRSYTLFSRLLRSRDSGDEGQKVRPSADRLSQAWVLSELGITTQPGRIGNHFCRGIARNDNGLYFKDISY
ncbi:hypothetical protein QQF64_005476 [Cirrhinus molitorella]|uniref:Uncharacterized protein n=1 Tax=Cirrhinus molitorella TaxID=172907 RepID=A0ABR3MFN6_9TELE